MSENMVITTPIRLEYAYTPGAATSRFLRAVADGRLIGEKCSKCGKVYVPPRGSCPRCGILTPDEVPVRDTGTVTTFCIVNMPFAGSVPVPYVSASVLLDGADISIFHLIQNADVNDVRMGMRVRAVWAPPEERKPDMRSILHFTPTGEPDVPIDKLVEHA